MEKKNNTEAERKPKEGVRWKLHGESHIGPGQDCTECTWIVHAGYMRQPHLLLTQKGCREKNREEKAAESLPEKLLSGWRRSCRRRFPSALSAHDRRKSGSERKKEKKKDGSGSSREGKGEGRGRAALLSAALSFKSHRQTWLQH